VKNHALSRRDLLIGGSTAAIVGAAEFNDTASAAANTYDVIIVGAGSAGISAARTVQSYGRSVLVLEAQDRVGGRAYTDNTFPVPFDLGAQFLGDVATGNNILYHIAKAFRLETFSADLVPFGFLNGDPLAFLGTYAAALTALLTQGELVRDGLIKDMTIDRALRGFQHLSYLDVAVLLLLLQDGADPATSSLLDYFNFSSHSPAPFVYPPNDTFFLPSGMGNLITRLSSGLPITLNAPVESISYAGTWITIRVAGGRTYNARKLIVTPSMGVLASGAIAFDPPLPQRYSEAIAALPMGDAYKAAFTFKKNIFAGHQGVKGRQMNSLIELEGHPGLSVFVNNFGQPMAYFVADGALGAGFESMSEAQAARFFLRILDRYFPGAIAEWTGNVRTTGWLNNPYTRGCTSFATVGNASARTRLAKPISRKIWFAGEALSITDHSQIQGAWLSGQTAAYGALSSLGVAVPQT